MMAVCICLIIPTIMSATTSPAPETSPSRSILILSRAIAITLLILCVSYLYFQFSTHNWVLHAGEEHGAVHQNPHAGEDSRSVVAALATSSIIACSTASLIICAYHLVGSVYTTAEALDINKTFVGLVLIPPTGYFAKSITIISVARRCQMPFVMRTVITSILQVTLFIIPFLILFGWVIDQPFALDFNVFNATAFFLTVIVMTSTVQDGKTNYFDGIMMMGT
jgi:Ca2+:H+ antiporter